MKKIYSLFVIICTVTLIVITRGNTAAKVSGKETKLMESAIVASFKLMRPLPTVPERIMVYKTVAPKISQKDMRELMKSFALDAQIIERRNQFVVKDQDRVLEVFKQSGTGYIRYSDNAKLADENEAKNLPSEDEAVDKAKKFLRANGLLPENTFLEGVGYYESVKYDTEGKIVVQGKSALAVGFGFNLEGRKVEGPGAKASVVFGEEAKIIGASKIWREIEPDRKIKILSAQEAFTEFKKKWPGEAKQGQFEKAKMKTEVTIREIYLAYYAKPGCLPQSHIDPVYLFKGDYRTSGRIKEREIKDGDSFEIIISAVPKPTE